MTVNKAQGQTIPNVGVYLPEPVFSHGQLYVALSRATARSNVKIHGQLYVALSRATARSNVKILAIPAVDEKKKKRKNTGYPKIDGIYTKNIVYKEVLTP